MTDGPPDAGYAPRTALTWADTFRVFQVALDPRKLAVAAAGILVMSLGWFLLSQLFWAGITAPSKDDPRFSKGQVDKDWKGHKVDGKDFTEAQLEEEGVRRYELAVDAYRTWADLAGPGGRLRTLPWNEYRGPNPFTLVTDLVSGTPLERQHLAAEFLGGTVPVLVEPLTKLLLPMVKMLDPYATLGQRFYLLLCLVWSVATWAFFGGIITRIAAVQLSGKDRLSLPEAVKFVIARYTSYALSPLVPVGLILVIALLMALYGMVALIPFVGDVILYGLGLPLVLLGGVVLAVLLIGLVGYPLMFATISVEGTDTFDAISRAYNYVFQAPWTYLGRGLAAVLYGALVTFFVVFAGSLAVYMGKWAVSQAPLSEYTNRKPDYLFVYAPESFGWKELLLRGSPAEQMDATPPNPITGRRTIGYVDVNPSAANDYRSRLWLTEKIGAALASIWLTLVLLLVIGFSYSYFWCASVLIYLAMRQKVDETEPDEIYLDDDAPEPLPPPAGVTVPSGPAAGGLSLPTTGESAAVPGVALSPNVVAPPGSTMTTLPPPAAVQSPEVGNPVKADGGIIQPPPAGGVK